MSDKLTSLIADVKEQVLFMQELGVDALEVDSARIEMPSPKAIENPKPREVSKARQTVPDTAQRPATTKESRLSALPSLRERAKGAPPAPSAPARAGGAPISSAPDDRTPPSETALIDMAPRLEETTDTIDSIRADIGACTRCKLHALGRKQI